jgi:hypothetical protein
VDLQGGAGEGRRRRQEKVAEAIRTMDTREGSAKFFPGGRMKFDEQGRRVDADLSSCSGRTACRDGLSGGLGGGEADLAEAVAVIAALAQPPSREA